MNKLTYKEAYDKIIEAYFKDEIQPLSSIFCFCGNLCNKNPDWAYSKYDKFFGYSYEDFRSMEKALFNGMDTSFPDWHLYSINKQSKEYEDSLFAGIVTALETLKKIHIGRGEIINEPITAKKRQLA